jgi:hypothetical protein
MALTVHGSSVADVCRVRVCALHCSLFFNRTPDAVLGLMSAHFLAQITRTKGPLLLSKGPLLPHVSPLLNWQSSLG